MAFPRHALMVAGILLAVGCSEDEGSLTAQFEWSGGRPEFARSPYVFVAVLQGETAVRASGPFELIPGPLRIDLPGLAFGTNLRLRARVHDAPYENASVLYAGTSEPFDFEAGDNLSITVVLTPVSSEVDLPDGPPPPQLDRVVHVRSPWANPPIEAVRGEAGAAEPGRRILVLDAEDVAVANPLGTAPVAADGSFSIDLAAPIARVFVATARGASLVSDEDPGQPGLQAGRVSRVEWTASFGAKTSGSTFRNPHALQVTRRFEDSLVQSSSSLTEVSTEDYARVFSGESPSPTATPALQWLPAPAGDAPSPRAGAEMAFDPVRGRVVLFGGFRNETDLSDTWEWDGRVWRQVAVVGASPQARSGHSVVYSDAEQAVLLIGGGLDDGLLQDLWSFDGTRWTRLGDVPAEVAGFSAQIAYDRARQRLVAFGGCRDVGCAPPLSGDTWTWDGETWQRLVPSGPQPPPRHDGRLVPLPDGTLLLFGGDGGAGGDDGSDEIASTWLLDGDQWRPYEGVEPPARSNYAMVARDNDAWLYGGSANRSVLDDVWVFSDGRWTEQMPTSERPAPRGFHGAAFDRHRGVSVVFGGGTPSFTADTWTYAENTWTSAGVASDEAAGPLRAAAAYHDRLGGVLSFGGRQGSGRTVNDVRLWAEGRWQPLSTASAPPPLEDSAAAYDPARNLFVVFGGVSNEGEATSSTYVLDGTETWTEISAPPELTPRQGHRMAYSALHGGIILFGGLRSDGTFAGDTWRFDGGQWQRLFDEGPNRPTPRAFFGMTFDAELQAVVLYGGNEQDPTLGTASASDLWLLDTSGWRQVTFGMFELRPPPLSEHRLTYDPQLQETVLTGGCAFAGTTCLSASGEVWSFDGRLWLNRSPRVPVVPPVRQHIAVFDPRVAGVIVHGGLDGNDDSQFPGTYAVLTRGFESAQWVPLESRVQAPSPRANARIAFEPRLNRMLLYGGCTRIACQHRIGDTWEWTGSAWIRRRHENPDIPALGDFGFAPAPGLGLGMTLAGLYWFWDGDRWRFIAPLFSEPRLTSIHAAYDSANDRTLLYGTDSAGTFAFQQWQISSVEPLSLTDGPERFGVNLAFDEARGSLVVFGGCPTRRCDSPSDALIEWKNPDGSGNRWIPVERSEPWPPARAFGSMVYDSAAQRTILFGGLGERVVNDVWTWDGARWDQIAIDGALPSIRVNHTAAFDRRRNEMVIMGGFIHGVTLGDTWVLPTGGVRPAFVATFDLSAPVTGFETEDIAQVILRGVAGPDPEVFVWRAADSRWVPVDSVADSFDIPLSGDAQTLFAEDAALHVAVVPGLSGTESRLTLSHLELSVLTR